jgi:nucleoside-diphosphate-sugar epimerase
MQPDPRPHPAYSYYPLSLRFFNVYGPRQDPSSPYSGVLSLFMKHLLARNSPTIFGDGEQSRDFTYVEDVAELCVKAAHARGVEGKMYNAGNGGRYTLNLVERSAKNGRHPDSRPLRSAPRGRRATLAGRYFCRSSGAGPCAAIQHRRGTEEDA